MGKLRRNSHPSTAAAAAEDSKPPPRSFFLGCFGFSGEAKPTERQKSSKDRSLRRRKMAGSCPFFSTDHSSAVEVQRTGSDPSGLVLPIPISTGQDTAAFESALFRKPKHEGRADIIINQLKMDDDVASKEEVDKFRDPISMTSSNRNDHAELTPPAKASRRRRRPLCRSRSLPAPAKEQMKAGGFPAGKEYRKSYGAGLLIAAVTMAVMLVWGRVCAIICVSGFLYAFPLLSRDSGEAAERSDSKSNDVVDDVEKKRQVVLDGFLQRSPAAGGNGINVNLL